MQAFILLLSRSIKIRAAEIRGCGGKLNKETQLLTEKPPPPREMSATRDTMTAILPLLYDQMGGLCQSL